MEFKTTYIQSTDLLAKLPIFYQPWWLDIVCKNWGVAHYTIDKEIVALFPYTIENKLGISLIRPPLLTPYLSPFIVQNKNNLDPKIIFETILKQLPTNGFKQFTPLPFQKYFIENEIQGYIKSKRQTYYINLLETEEALWSKVQSRRKNYINKGYSDLTIEAAEFNAAEFMPWHKHSFENKNKNYPYTVDFLQNITQAAAARDASLCYRAINHKNEPVATIWNVYDHNTMYYLLGSVNPTFNDRNAMSTLMWHTIIQAKKLGLSIFDFEGSMDKGIADFFSKFGGSSISYYSFEQNSSWLWKLKRVIMGG